MVKNYLGVLGYKLEEVDIKSLSDGKLDKELKRRYRGLIKRLHPDANVTYRLPDNIDRGGYMEYSEELTKEINEAYEVLSDRTKRVKWLRELSETLLRREKPERAKMETLITDLKRLTEEPGRR